MDKTEKTTRDVDGRRRDLRDYEISQLNNKEVLIFQYCSYNPMSFGELARKLKIKVSSLNAKIHKLEKMGILEIISQGKGKKKFVRVKGENKVIEILTNVLEEIKSKRVLSESEINYIIFKDTLLVGDQLAWDHDKRLAEKILLRGRLVSQKFSISETGEKFLKDSNKDKYLYY